MELSRFSDAASCSATQEFSYILWNPKVYYRVHKNPPLVPILNHMLLVHKTPFFFSEIHFSIILPATLIVGSGLFTSGFFTEILYALSLA
jgi:hypothetical protein